MTHKLRNSYGGTLIEIEASMDDISSAVIIRVFGSMLGDLAFSQRQEFIDEMDALNELRREYWEDGARGLSADELVARRCKEMAEKWRLTYVTD